VVYYIEQTQPEQKDQAIMKSRIATFTTISIEKIVQNSLSALANPIAEALFGMDENGNGIDGIDGVDSNFNVADAVSELTIRARDVSFVGSMPQPVPDEVITLFLEAGVDISTGFTVGFNPQTTGLTGVVLVTGVSKADFLIWWNEFGG